MGIRDSKLVNSAWHNLPNYLIIEDNSGKGNLCAIYFSSNALYYPDTEEVFRERILNRNAYEWYGKRVPLAKKHIFVRDVFKCWYVKGINTNICDIFKLCDFLKKESLGYKTVCIGSSAGGYAAMLCGSIIKSEKVYAFNPQINLDGLISRYPLLNNISGGGE